MTAELAHIILESFAVLLCAYIAVCQFLRFGETRSALALGWGFAFALCAIGDTAHVLIDVLGGSSGAVIWSWCVSRLALIWALIWTVKARKLPDAVAAVTDRAGIVATVGLLLMCVPVVADVDPLAQVDNYWIARPFDAGLAVCYAAAMMWVLSQRHVRLEAPDWLHGFFMIGIFVHVLMAMGSLAAYDGVFLGAHILKLLEYGWWAAMLHTENVTARQLKGGQRERLHDRAQTMGLTREYDRLERLFRAQLAAAYDTAATAAPHGSGFDGHALQNAQRDQQGSGATEGEQRTRDEQIRRTARYLAGEI